MNKELTDKQKLYMHCLALGFSNKQIAGEMSITVDSVVNNYQERMLSKTYLSTRTELVEYAKQNGYGERNG